MKAIKILILVANVFLGNYATANDTTTFEFKGISLDSNISELFQKDELICKHPEQHLINVCAFKPKKKSEYSTFAGIKVEYILFHLYRNKLVKLFISMGNPREESSKIALEALTDKFGKPKSIKDERKEFWDISHYYYRNNDSRSIDNKANKWQKNESYMFYGRIVPGEEIRQDYTNPEQRWGFDPYNCYYDSANCSTRSDFGLMILSKEEYGNAIKAKLDYTKRKKEEKKLQLEMEAINDL